MPALSTSTIAAAEALEHAQSLLHLRELDAAISALHQAQLLGADPDACSAGLWLAHMLLGDFESAWRESDAIRHRGAPDPNRFWNGEDLRGKRVILRCLHGFGDAIQLLRYAPYLRSIASHLTVELPPRLMPLAPFLPAVGEAITWGPAAPSAPPQWEIQLEINELPYLFRTTLADLPIATNYLHLPPNAIAEAARTMAPLPPLKSHRIGIVWAAGDWNTTRSIPLALLVPILQAHPCMEFWSLQGGTANSEAQPLFDSGLLRDASICGDGILPLASVIANLDLVITVDTLAAHLAGALGKPAVVLLQHAADWRWMHHRSDTPWYPTLRLLRQNRDADWSAVTQHLNEELSLLRHQPSTRIA